MRLASRLRFLQVLTSCPLSYRSRQINRDHVRGKERKKKKQNEISTIDDRLSRESPSSRPLLNHFNRSCCCIEFKGEQREYCSKIEKKHSIRAYVYGYFRMVYEHPAVENRNARTGVSSFYGNWPALALKSSQRITPD